MALSIIYTHRKEILLTAISTFFLTMLVAFGCLVSYTVSSHPYKGLDAVYDCAETLDEGLDTYIHMVVSALHADIDYSALTHEQRHQEILNNTKKKAAKVELAPDCMKNVSYYNLSWLAIDQGHTQADLNFMPGPDAYADDPIVQFEMSLRQTPSPFNDLDWIALSVSPYILHLKYPTLNILDYISDK